MHKSQKLSKIKCLHIFGHRIIQIMKQRLYSVGHKKRSQLSFVSNFGKNQQILMQFSLLDFKMNDTCEGINFNHLT